jgi:uncharacterized SAM-binding protein YcdF (DUF218 family)
MGYPFSNKGMDEILLIKIISALLYPLGLVFLLAIFAWILPRSKMTSLLKLTSFSVLIIASNPMAARWLVQSLEKQYPQQAFSEITTHDAILVLGGGLRLPITPALHTQLGAGSDRYWHAARLYRAGKAQLIMVSGGNVFAQLDHQGEAYYAARLLRSWGVPKAAIITESGSRNTTQNISASTEFFGTNNISSVLLVTSAYHMPRALRAFKHLSVRVTPASADILIRTKFSPPILDWIPTVSALGLTTLAVHEYYGMWFADLKTLIDNG